METRKLHRLNRVIYHHSWDRIEEWAASLAELADLADDELADLERMIARETGAICCE